ncbi:protein AKNAD1 isoform X5 [Heterocephalus glaber]|uniref:Protein AKNAD1 isoform X5 n=1 Tax=Heterocephalus glaber TaxID=10181 RepID=A0AAX6TKF1_HETGA|nr:protein AKNAD1 isoform X5 [Heterocephalus glaber]
MDETDFSEDTTYKQQEDLPYDDTVSPMKMCDDGNFTSKNNIPGVSDQVILTEDDPHEKAEHNEICLNTAVAMTWDKITENDFLVDKKGDPEKLCSMNLYIPANEGYTSKSKISDILLHHLSKDPFLGGQGIDCETLPEISHADSTDEAAIITNISSCYVKNFWYPEFNDQLNPNRDGGNSSKPSCSPSSSDVEEQVAVGNSSHQENSNFLTKITGLSDKQKSCQGQEPQKQLTKKASSSNVFKYGQGQVHYQLPDFSKVAPKVKIPKNNLMSKSLTMAKQASSSPKLRNKSTIVQDILENLSRSNCVEKQQPEKKRKITDPSQQIQMESTVHIHQELLTGLESETSLLKLTSASPKDLPSSSSSIFQKICQGKQMCQKLKEQTDQLKTKVQEFSKRIQQDSLCHLQDRKLVLEQLQGHLQVLERNFVATREKHLALQQHIHKHESPAVGDFDPERSGLNELWNVEGSKVTYLLGEDLAQWFCRLPHKPKVLSSVSSTKKKEVTFCRWDSGVAAGLSSGVGSAKSVSSMQKVPPLATSSMESSVCELLCWELSQMEQLSPGTEVLCPHLAFCWMLFQLVRRH